MKKQTFWKNCLARHGLWGGCLLGMIFGTNFDAFAQQLPKTPQATAIQVFDLSQDLSSRSLQAEEADYCLTAIQGLVNRTSTNKIYFTNTPCQYSWLSPSGAPPNNDQDDQAALVDGLIPVPQSKPTVNTNLAYPVLAYLLGNYSNYIQGMVMIPSCGSPTNYDGALAAGFTACGGLNAIPVSAGISNYIASLGFNFPVLADTRSLSNNVAAFQWAYTNYFTTNTCRKVIAYFTPWGYGAFTPTENFADALDYWIANRVFVFCLDPYVPAQNNELPLFLNTTNYPYATPIQAVEYEEADAYMFDSYGYPDDVVQFANMSVTCSFPSVSTNIMTPTPEVPANIDPNGVYLSFYISDGDSFDVTTRMHYWGITRDYINNTYPVGWTINPEFFDLFPTLLQYLSSYNAYPANIALGENTNTLEYIAAGFHGSFPQGVGYTNFINRYQYYQQNTHGMFRMTDIGAFQGSGLQTPPLSPAETIAADAGFPGFLSGYQGADGNVVCPWAFLIVSNAVNGNMVTNVVSTTLVSGETQDSHGNTIVTAQSIINAVNNNLNFTPLGQPIFMTIAICSGDPGYPDATGIASIAPAMSQLALTSNNGRHYYCLRPSDVAGTWKKWYQSLDNQLANPNWQPTTPGGSDGGRDWSYTYANNNEGAYQLNDIYYAGYNPVNDGTYGFLKAQITGSIAGDFQYATSHTNSATPGSLWQASAHFCNDILQGSQEGLIVLKFLGSSNQSITNVAINSSSAQVNNGNNTWYLGAVSGVAPAGTTGVCMEVGIYQPSAVGSSEYVLVDNAALGPIAPPAPSNVTATLTGGNAVLNWNASAGATSYVIMRSTSPNGAFAPIYTNTGTSYTDNTVAAGTEYYYEVEAVNTNSDGVQSSTSPVASEIAGSVGLSAVSTTINDGQVVGLVVTIPPGLNANNPVTVTLSSSSTGIICFTESLMSEMSTYAQTLPYLPATVTFAAGATNQQVVNVEGVGSGTAPIYATCPGLNESSVLFTVSSAAGAPTSVYNLTGIYTDGTMFGQYEGLDTNGDAYSANLLGASVNWNGTTFVLGPANFPDAMTTGATCPLPPGHYGTLYLLGTGFNGGSGATTVTVNYTDGSISNYLQGFSDWGYYQNYPGESLVKTMAYRDTFYGLPSTPTAPSFNVYGYTFPLDTNKIVSSVTVPNTNTVAILAAVVGPLSPPGDVTATAGNGRVILSWNQSSGAASYNLMRSTVSGEEVIITNISCTNSSGTLYVDNGLVNGTTYYYEVSASNSSGSAISSQVSATPTSVWSLPGSDNITAIFTDGTVLPNNTGMDGAGSAYSATLLGSSVNWNGATFTMGEPNVPDAICGGTYSLLQGQDSVLEMLGTGVNGGVSSATVTVNYMDGTSSNYTQSFSDWANYQNYPGESIAKTMSYRDQSNGSETTNISFNLYGYSFALNTNKVISSVTLPNTNKVVILAMNATPAAPTGLAALAGNGEVSLSWSANAGVVGYNVMRSTVSGGEVTITNVSSASYVDSNVVNGTTYYYKVSATNAAGQNGNSSQVGATPSATTQSAWSLIGSNNVTAIYTDGRVLLGNAGADGGGNAYSANLLGSGVNWNGATFTLGPPNIPDALSSQTCSLPQVQYTALEMLGTGVDGGVGSATVTVTYTDGSSSNYTQGFSDWYSPEYYTGESIVVTNGYRDNNLGSTNNSGPFYVYGYSFALNPNKVVSRVTLPNTPNVIILAMAATLVPITSSFNLIGVVTNGFNFPDTAGLGGGSAAYSANLLGSTINWNGSAFILGPPNTSNAVTSTTCPLPAGQYTSLELLATAVFGNQTSQVFTVTYSNGATSNYVQSLSDWGGPQHYAGESVVATNAYRDLSNGTEQDQNFYLYGYNFPLNSSKTVSSVTLPNNTDVVVLAAVLTPVVGGGDTVTGPVKASPGIQPAFVASGQLQLNLAGPANANFRLWSTTNLTLQPVINTWTLLAGGTFNAVGKASVTDAGATNSTKFYTITQP